MTLHTLPSLFAAVADPRNKGETVQISCTLDDDAARVLISAIDGTNATFTNSYSETELKKSNEGSLQSILKDLETGFSSNNVKLSADGNGCTLTVKGASELKFALTKSSEGNGSLKLLENLFYHYSLRNDKTAASKIIEDLTKKDADLKKKVIMLEQEKVQLTETIAHAEIEEKTTMEMYTDLQRELSELTEKHKRMCEELGKSPDEEDAQAPVDPDFTQCIGRIPMGPGSTCRDFDEALIKLIKSKFTPYDPEDEKDDPNPVHMKVVRPWTTSEYEQQMQGLGNSSRAMVMKVIEKIDKWDYDVWTIQDFTNKGALFHTAYALFMRWDFLRKYKIDEQVAINFFSQIEAGYHPNPYHNAQHGADVLHIIHFIIKMGQLESKAHLTGDDILAALIAGMIHDYDHPGLNNNFHIKVQSYLATLYNDRSILENHHCAEVFELMKNPQFDILAGLTDPQRRDVRETIIEMVLSTDMGLHAKIFGTWKRRIAQDHELHKRKDDQRLALSMAIKMADISNCGRPENLYLKWGTKLAEEFFLQGDNERNRGDTVSPFMDRFAPSMAKSQIAFMNFVVIPMFESIAEYLPDMHFSVDHCESNKNYWASNDDSL